ncbi:hypothetical protein MWU61_02025 [Loktanella sp. F6476L]|uniref:hypothetical protein n=1 Tax=Loktanella sp. F6476L TaxID=2926405 RepID=UPI001FF488A1|nr:hypothetical protein [Loktanella sp. F6476L]MCK0119301.1 hypothetical protein [Loktanella sp. F6476L]
MAGSTKILTVSYGTFSCTLEGFDDSFHSMKAIAEYFRDLAQDDRYFGAEPPAPDAEMLAKIAEREISRRVEAKMDGKGIRLRAEIDDDTTTQQTVTMPPKAEAPVNAESPSALMPAASLVAAPAVEIDEVAPEAANDTFKQDAPAHPDAESVAAKLQRIRAVVGKPAAPVEESYEDGAGAEEPLLGDAEADVVKITAEDIIADEHDAEAEAKAQAEAQAAAEAAEAEAAEAEAKAQQEAQAAEAEAKAQEEAQAAAEAAEAEAKAQKEAQAAAEAEAKAQEEAQAAAEAKAREEAQAAAEAAEAEAKALEEAQSDLSSDLNDIDVPNAEQAETQKAPVRARIVRLRKDKPAEVVAEPVVEEAEDDADVAQRVAAALKVDTPEVVADEVEAVIEDAPEAEPTADVAEIEEVVADETSKQDEIRAAVAAAIPSGSLSADEEDDLQRELAAVAEDVVSIEDEAPEVAEIVIEDTAAEAPEMPEVVETPARAGRGVLPEPDTAVSRILNQTDAALNEPTGSRRRNAIAQLKAAVAATEAARQLGDQSRVDAEKQEAFRDDLDQVVRPRRPASPEDQALRTERPRAAPLKLVASQRVDEDDAIEEDVQPRRVATQPVDAKDTGGFAEFAAQMGASDLPDLLEAAAAYTSFVEGVEDFSRPQIMKKVQLTTDEEFSREDGLRSFGTLLRQGRISKVRNGRFQVSEQTRFRPDARSA